MLALKWRHNEVLSLLSLIWNVYLRHTERVTWSKVPLPASSKDGWLFPCSVFANVLSCWSSPTGGCPELTWDAPVGRAFAMLLRSLRGLKAGDMDDSKVINGKWKKGQYGLPWFWRVWSGDPVPGKSVLGKNFKNVITERKWERKCIQ